MPDLIDFISYCFFNQNFKSQYLGFKKSKATIANWGIKGIDWNPQNGKRSAFPEPPLYACRDIRDLAKMAEPIVSPGNQTGRRLVPDW